MVTTTSLVKQYLDKHIDLNSVQLAQLMISENRDRDWKASSLSALIRQVKVRNRKTSTIEVVDVSVENDTKWIVEDGFYKLKTSRGSIQLSVEFIDNLFYEYSEYGLNLSQTEIINKHNLKVWEWHSIKRQLELYKKSNIFSPYTVEQTDPKALQEMISSKLDKLFANIGYQVEHQYDKKIKQEYRKVITKDAETNLFAQTVVNELHDMLIDSKLHIYPKSIKDPEECKVEALCVFIFDVHFGAENRSKLLPIYSPEILSELFDRIAEEVNKIKAKEVHIFFGGDNIETFSGFNHPDAWKGIAKGHYGAELIKRAYQLYVQFINNVYNVKTIYAVPGNHDRAIDDKKKESEGWMAELLFELIKLSLDNSIEIKYEPKLISESIDGIHYIASHGDKKITNIHAAELILRYGDPYKFNLLVSGHLHNRIIKKDHENFRQIVCPSLFPGNDYSIDLGYSSSSGVVFSMNNGNGKPKIIDITL